MFPTPAIRRWSRSHDRTGRAGRASAACRRAGGEGAPQWLGPHARRSARPTRGRPEPPRCRSAAGRRRPGRAPDVEARSAPPDAWGVARRRRSGREAAAVMPRFTARTPPPSRRRITFLPRRSDALDARGPADARPRRRAAAAGARPDGRPRPRGCARRPRCGAVRGRWSPPRGARAWGLGWRLEALSDPARAPASRCRCGRSAPSKATAAAPSRLRSAASGQRRAQRGHGQDPASRRDQAPSPSRRVPAWKSRRGPRPPGRPGSWISLPFS